MIKEENKQAEHDNSYFWSYKWAFNDLFDNKLHIFQFESQFRNEFRFMFNVGALEDTLLNKQTLFTLIGLIW